MRAAAVYCFVASILFTSLSIAGTTGKIVGTVVDEKSGEKLISANVLIEGTTMGASTNVNGYYVILNIPPGTYRLRASLIGYANRSIVDVRVEIDQTTTIDIALGEETMVGEEVVIVATRPVVQKDVSASRANITADQVTSLPVAAVTSVVGLQAGIQTNSEGQLLIRGGAADQTVFSVNGLELRDGRDNTPYTSISLSSIEDVQVQTGGFNAEYGNVRSGRVNVVTKEGGAGGYTFNIITRYSPKEPKHFGVPIYDANSYWIRPYLDPSVAFAGTEGGAWDQFTQRQYPKFEGWNSVSQKLLNDTDPTNDLSPLAAQQVFLWQHRRIAQVNNSDYDIDMGFGGPVPFIHEQLGNLRFFASYRRSRNMYLIPLSDDAFRDYNAQIKLTSDLGKGMKITVEGLLGQSSGTNDNNAGNPGLFTSASTIADVMTRVSFIETRIFATDYWAPSVIKRNMFGAKFTHVITPQTFYSASIHRFQSEYGTGPGRARDTRPLYLFGNSYYVDEAPFGFQPAPSNGINNMRMGVGMSNSRDSSTVSVWTTRFDMTSQFDEYNQVQGGIELVYTDMDVNYASVDEFLPAGRSRSQFRKFPIQGAAYLQDKIEFEGMIANLGVRLDYSHAGGEWFRYDPFTKAFSAAQASGIDTVLEKAETKRIVTLSPRLGVSFPISIDSKIYFNYGHFRSLPAPEDLFLLRRFSDNNQITRIADPDKPFPLTVSYELGYEQNLFDQFLLRLAGYYKDVSQEGFLVRYTSASGDVNYQVSTPNRYRDIRGFEMTIAKNRGEWIQGFLNYTYDVRTTGYFGLNQYWEDRGQQRAEERDNVKQEKPVPQPYARMNVDFLTPVTFGPDWGGIYPIGDWRVNVIANWSNGEYFSWTGGSDIQGIENNVQWTDIFNVNLRVSKGFRFDRFNFQVFMDISNLLDTKRMARFGGVALGFVDLNDYLDYMRSLHLPADIAGDPLGQKLGYANIPGDDKPGQFRENGAAFQPIVAVDRLANLPSPQSAQARPFYYVAEQGQYYQFTNGTYQLVDQGRVDQVLEDKAYIDMPNQPQFSFLNPRDIFFGLKFSFDL